MQIFVTGSSTSSLPAWVQAIGSIAAISVAIWIPNRERQLSRKHEIITQTAALTAIGERIFWIIDRIHSRAGNAYIERRELPWLSDEAEATKDLADRVDLTSIKDASLIPMFVQLQEAVRTTSRRLAQDRVNLSPTDTQLAVDPDRFDDPYERASRWLEKLRQKNAAIGESTVNNEAASSTHRSDFVLRSFAVVVSVGFAGALARTPAVRDYRLPTVSEVGPLACLIAGLVFIIGSWEGYQRHKEKSDRSKWVFATDTTIVFIYLVTLLYAANAYLFLLLVGIVFLLYCLWGVILRFEFTEERASQRLVISGVWAGTFLLLAYFTADGQHELLAAFAVFIAAIAFRWNRFRRFPIVLIPVAIAVAPYIAVALYHLWW